MKIAVIIGSLRKESLNRKLFEAYARIAGNHFEFQEIRYDDFPLYNQDLQDKEMPQTVLLAAEGIRNSAGVLFVSPEYNYSIPGPLKNAIDWLSRTQPQAFTQKPASIMGASMGKMGTGRAQYDLRKVGVFLDLHFMNKPEVMLGSAHEAFTGNGELKDDSTKKFLETHALSFKKWIEKFQS